MNKSIINELRDRQTDLTDAFNNAERILGDIEDILRDVDESDDIQPFELKLISHDGEDILLHSDDLNLHKHRNINCFEYDITEAIENHVMRSCTVSFTVNEETPKDGEFRVNKINMEENFIYIDLADLPQSNNQIDFTQFAEFGITSMEELQTALKQLKILKNVLKGILE